MSYQWDWGILFSPVATGEGSTYFDWLLSGFTVTLVLTLCTWVGATVIGVTLGVFRTVPNPACTVATSTYVAIFRNVPLIVQLFTWYFVVPEILPSAAGDWLKSFSPFNQFFACSLVCLSLFTSARICEQVRSAIDAIPVGQYNAGLAIGLTRFQVYRHVLLPVGFRIIVPPLTSEFVSVSKNSAVASTIGLAELSAQAQHLVDYTAHSYEAFIAVTAGYMIINLLTIILMRQVEKAVRIPGYLGAKG
jgi:glutamate/aspartate transport system permease protein